MIPKLRKILEEKFKPKTEKIKPVILSKKDVEDCIIIDLPQEKTEAAKLIERIKEVGKGIKDDGEYHEITKEDCNIMIEQIKSTRFDKLIEKVSLTEALIITLRLGYFEGKYFSVQTDAKLLNISEKEVRMATQKAMLWFSDDLSTQYNNPQPKPSACHPKVFMKAAYKDDK